MIVFLPFSREVSNIIRKDHLSKEGLNIDLLTNTAMKTNEVLLYDLTNDGKWCGVMKKS